jgi:hypothetical protein
MCWLHTAVLALYEALDRNAAPLTLCLVTDADRDVVAYTVAAGRPPRQVDRRLVVDLAAVAACSVAATVNVTPEESPG